MSPNYARDTSGLEVGRQVESAPAVWMVLYRPGDRGVAAPQSQVRRLFSANLNMLLHIERIHGRTASSVAEELGVRETLLSTWRRGLAFPRAEQIDRICEVLGIKPDMLFRESGLTGEEPEEVLVDYLKSKGYHVVRGGKS